MRLLPFTAIDGESIDNQYCLLSTQHKSIVASPRLTTCQCLDFILSLDGILVGYAFHFDACHILRDLPKRDQLLALHSEEVQYGKYSIRYIPRKMLTIYADRKRRVVYDTFGFFQSSFIGALETMGMSVPDEIVAGKQSRGDFKRADIETIKQYNTLECVLLAQMMTEFRQRIRKSFSIRSWHGAGAISRSLLHKWDPIADDMAKLELYPAKVKEAFDASFYGGKIELEKVGSLKNLYGADINSAYPFALSCIPSLPNKFLRVKKFIPDTWGVYKIKWDWTSATYRGCELAPFPVRTPGGLVVYPLTGEGWYTSCEVATALLYEPHSVEILDGYVYHSSKRDYTQLVTDLYNTRRDLKDAGDGSQIGYKLGLNALYGMLAQAEKGNTPAGRFHHPVLKTLITGFIRARMFDAAMQSPDSIVSFSTDGIVSTTHLDLCEGRDLGEWTVKHYKEGLFLMSGIYQLDEETRKTRGFKRLNIKRCASYTDRFGKFSISFDSFVSPLLANEDGREAFTFQRFKKQVRIYNNVKRDYAFLHELAPHKRKSLLSDVWESKAWHTADGIESDSYRKLDITIE